MRADGSDQTRLTHDAAADRSPAWSPDGSRIAYVSARDAERAIYLVRPDGRAFERLTVGATATNDVPVWSPDGSRIAFQTVRGKDYDLALVRVADRARVALAATPAYDGMCAWSPDGMRLAFISGREGYDALYVVDADGGRPRRLTSTPSLDPAWSP